MKYQLSGVGCQFLKAENPSVTKALQTSELLAASGSMGKYRDVRMYEINNENIISER